MSKTTSKESLATLKIRRAKISDAEQMAILACQLGYPATTAQMRKRFGTIKPASQHAVFVADTLSAGVIGWIHVSRQPLLDVDLRAEINGLIIAEGHRSLGAGAKLVAAAEAWARSRGCAAMSVRSNVIRERAHLFYERCGFQHYKTQKSFRKPL